ncbi:MAG TPA: FG-GAP repeat protein [Blastocatellia bacterium]|nr:FG-GAP repeat protein [Blastocatellia bacterium]
MRSLSRLSMILTLITLGAWLAAESLVRYESHAASQDAASMPSLQGAPALNHLKEQGLYDSLLIAMAATRPGAYTEVASPALLDPPLAQQAYLKASNTDPGDFLGVSVAISGDTAVVAAYLESSAATGVNGDQSDNSMSESGAVYVFVRNGGNWSQQAYLKASNTSAVDHFGFSVCVSGDTAVVTAPLEDSNATGVNGNQDDNSAKDAGAAYIFVRNGGNWSQQAYLKASNTGAGEQFSYSVAISDDKVVAGTPLKSDNPGFNSGAAYVFARSGGNWSQQAYLKASNADARDDFGRSVAISGDTVVAGTPGEDSNATGVNGDQNDNSASTAGAAYIFAPDNTPPAISAAAVTRSEGAGSSNSIIANVSDPDQALDTLSVTVSGDGAAFGSSATRDGVTVSNITVDAAGVVEADVVAVCGSANANFTLKVTDNAGEFSDATLKVMVVDTTAPTLTLKPAIGLWPPNHKYHTITIAQMVENVSDGCHPSLGVNDVKIEKVTSDEPDNAACDADGNTTLDIVIAADCKSAQLRSERDERKNGRVYSINLRVRDGSGNTTRRVFKVSVPIGQNGVPAVDSGVAFTVNSNCR